jgi:hypothetical protein
LWLKSPWFKFQIFESNSKSYIVEQFPNIGLIFNSKV